MQALIKNKMLIALVFVLIIGTLMYRAFSGGVAAPEGDSALTVGQDLIKLSDQLSRATLSQDIFTMRVYTSLVDFTVPLPQQSFGRPNPFDLIGRD